MDLTLADLDRGPRPPHGWPRWAVTTPYRGRAFPGADDDGPLELGANCQRYAYAILGLFGLIVPPHRSSELWEAPELARVARTEAKDLDLALFSPTGAAWGAHVAVVLRDRLLHLSATVGRPALWNWTDFAAHPQYRTLVGIVRVRSA